MQLNGIDLAGYSAEANRATFVLEGVTMQDALNLDGQTLTVTQDGTDYAIYAGYSVVEVKEQADGNIAMTAMRKLGDQTAEAINGLDASVTLLTSKLGAVETSASDAAAKADEAKTAADEAKTAAEQAGTDPQVKAASAMYVNAQALSNTQLADVRDLIEDFVQGAEYEQGWVRRYEGKYYRMAQKITSTTSQTYLPGTGTESLYTLIDLAPDGIRVWHAPADATNSFALGERCHYPDADGPVYVSGRNGNTSEPTKDEWWTLAED